MTFHFHIIPYYLIIGSASTGLGAGGIAANSGGGQASLGAVNAADQLASHGAYDFGAASSGKNWRLIRAEINVDEFLAEQKIAKLKIANFGQIRNF